jgi:hypothetical protein
MYHLPKLMWISGAQRLQHRDAVLSDQTTLGAADLRPFILVARAIWMFDQVVVVRSAVIHQLYALHCSSGMKILTVVASGVHNVGVRAVRAFDRVLERRRPRGEV